jgi:hypothetical protein
MKADGMPGNRAPVPSGRPAGAGGGGAFAGVGAASAGAAEAAPAADAVSSWRTAKVKIAAKARPMPTIGSQPGVWGSSGGIVSAGVPSYTSWACAAWLSWAPEAWEASLIALAYIQGSEAEVKLRAGGRLDPP